MNSMTRLELALRALTAIFVIVAAVVLIRTPAVPTVEIAPAGLDARPSKGSPLAAVDPAAGEMIIRANIFSASRAAPAVRYRPFDSDVGSAAPPIPESTTDPGVATDAEAVPQLFGTVLGPRGPTALMRLDPALPEAELYREGEGAGRYRVEKISERSVVLIGPRGRIVLQLKRPE